MVNAEVKTFCFDYMPHILLSFTMSYTVTWTIHTTQVRGKPGKREIRNDYSVMVAY